MKVEFEVSDVIPATPDQVYTAWLDSNKHSEMTGSPARISSIVGGEFQAWDGYIQGKNLELEPSSRILQLWRTIEFEDSDKDSLLEVRFESVEYGTTIKIRHSQLPNHGMQYQQGWRDSYFTPMKAYFESKSKTQDV
jgi:activator of HSP90 ATPase